MDRFLEAIVDAQSVEEVWSHHTRQMAKYGFDRLLYGFTRFRTERGFGSKDDILILSNHSSEYTRHFVDNGLYFHAPMVKWALANDGACSWRIMTERRDEMTEHERRVLAFNHSHNVTAGYSISFRDASIRNKGAIGLAAKPGLNQDEVDALWQEHGRDLVVMNTIVHMKLIGLPYSAPSRGLTARQRETLEWVRDGKVAGEIADIMGLTTATVEKHLRLARQALQVDTTAQAVLKASFLNQIFVLET